MTLEERDIIGKDLAGTMIWLSPVTEPLLRQPPEIPDERILTNLAHVMWSLGRTQESLTCLRLLEQREPLGPAELQMRGYWQLYEGQADAALATFTAALKADSTSHSTSRLGYAFALFYKYEYAAAAAVFQQLADEGADLKSPAPMAAACRALATGEKPEEVQMAPVPGLPPGMSDVLRTKILFGVAAAIDSAVDRVKSLTPDERLPLERLTAELLIENDQDQAALALIDRLLADSEGDGLLWMLKGFARRRLGQQKPSQEAFSYSTMLAPLEARGWGGLGASWAELSEHGKAANCFRVAVFLDPDNAFFWSDLGMIEAAEKNYAAARRAIDKAIDLGARTFDNYFNRGVCSFNLQEFADALSDFQIAITLDPHHRRAAEAQDLINKAGPSVDDRFSFGDLSL